MTWAEKIKDLLVKVTLYQYGKYSAEKLDRELTEFLKAAEGALCEAIRRNGGVCYKEALEEMTPREAEDYVVDQIKNFEMLGRTGKIIADLLRLSIEFKDLDKITLSDKVLLFDKVVHAEHAAGAFKEYLAEERSIFGVDITKIKEEADKEVEEILEGKKKAPDPPEPFEEAEKIIQELIEKAKAIPREEFFKYFNDRMHKIWQKDYRLHSEIMRIIEKHYKECRFCTNADALWAYAHGINPVLYDEDGWHLELLPDAWDIPQEDRELVVRMFKFVKRKYPHIKWELSVGGRFGIEAPSRISKPVEFPVEDWLLYLPELKPEWKKLEEKFGSKAVSTAYSMFHELYHLLYPPKGFATTEEEEKEADRFALKTAKEFFGVNDPPILEEILRGEREAPNPPRIDNTTAIVKLAGIDEKIKKEPEKRDDPYTKYILAMAEFLELPVEVVAKSEPVIKYYLRFKSD